MGLFLARRGPWTLTFDGVYFKVADQRSKTVTDPGIVFPGGGASFSGSESWVDLVVGAQVTHPISDRWSLMGYADPGGGGSSTTYQVLAGANWILNGRFTAKAGYRYVYWDYEDDGVVWDISASGPYIGLGIAF